MSVGAGINPAASSAASSSGAFAGNTTIANNFTAFLQLLTTQLKNQNPLEPLDTNQFTQQLVQFTQVEQQMKMNDQMATLIKLNETAEKTIALAYVGSTVVVDGATTRLQQGSAIWQFSTTKPASVSITITDATGAAVYTSSYTVQPGTQTVAWDGVGNNGTQYPDGDYTIAVTAKDASGQVTALPTEVQGAVDYVDVSTSPPVLAIGGQKFTLDKIKRVVRPGGAELPELARGAAGNLSFVYSPSLLR